MRVVVFLFATTLAAQPPDRVLGEAMAVEIRRESTPLGIPEVTAYVQRMGALAAPGEFRYEVIVNSATEPIALPGGTIFVPARLFLTARNEEEFVGLLAHGVAHIVLRHGFTPAREGAPRIYWRPGSDAALLPAGVRPLLAKWEAEADTYGQELISRAGLAGADSAAFRAARDLVATALGKPERRPPSLLLRR